MTPQTPPLPPPDDREARLTALLLGELSDDEAAALRQELEQDAELRRLHERLAQTIGLVREAAGAPDLDPLASPEAPKLSAERREKLLGSFKVVPIRPPTKFAQWRRAHWRECASLAAMLVALLLMAAVLTQYSVKQHASASYAYFSGSDSWRSDRPAAIAAVEVKDAEFGAEAALSRGEALAGSGFSAQLWGRPTVGSTPASRPESRRPAGAKAGEVTDPTTPLATSLATPLARRSGSALVALPSMDDGGAEVLERGRSSEMAQGRTEWFGNNEAKPGQYRGFGVNGKFLDAGASPSGGAGDSPDQAAKNSVAQLGSGERARTTATPAVPSPQHDAGFGGVNVGEMVTGIGAIPSTPPAAAAPQGGGGRGGGARGSAEYASVSPKPSGVASGPSSVVAEGYVPALLGAVIAKEEKLISQSGRQPADVAFTAPAPAQASAVQAAELALAGKLYFEAGKYDLAEAKLREALLADPANVDAEHYTKLTSDKKLAADPNASDAFGRDGFVAVQMVNPPPKEAGIPVALKGLEDRVSGRGTENFYARSKILAPPGVVQDLDGTPPPSPAGPAPGGRPINLSGVTAEQEARGGLVANPVPDSPARPSLPPPAMTSEPVPAPMPSPPPVLTPVPAPIAAGAVPAKDGEAWITVTNAARSDDYSAVFTTTPSLTPNQAQDFLSSVTPSAAGTRFFRTTPEADFGSVDARVLQRQLMEAATDKNLGKGKAQDFDAGVARKQEWDATTRYAPEKQPAAQTAGEPRFNKSRVEIALPQIELGEALEKTRVATGPVVVNEVMYDALATDLPKVVPATGLPAGQPVPSEGDALKRLAPAAKPAMNLEAIRRAQLANVEAEARTEGEAAGTTAQGASPDVARLTRELESLNYVRDRLEAKISKDQLEAKLPRHEIELVVEEADGAETSSRTLGQRIRGIFDDSVARTAKVALEKDRVEVEGIGAARMGGFDPYWKQTQMERIQSKELLSKVVAKLNLNEAWAKEHGGGQNLRTDEAVKLLQRKLDVLQDANGSLLDIRAKSDNAEEAARIANAVAQVYKEDRLARWGEMNTNVLRILEQELAVQNQKIAAVQQQLERHRRSVPPQQADAPAPTPPPDTPIPQPEVAVIENAFSTFSLNVSDVSFKLAAASLEKGQMPEPASIRTEEFINAFDYRDPEPGGSAPVAFAWERARYPFAHDRDLVRFSVKTAASGRQPGRPLNLVLAIDNSGSMERADRVRILRECLRVLGTQLQPQDRVSVVAFARTARLVADGLPGSQGRELPERAGDLTPQGGTNLEDALNLAYQAAQRHYLSNGVNRVVLLTDGAANLGDVQPASLKAKVEAHRRQGIALDCFGIGWDGYNDDLLEQLSRNGDGRYGFVNTTEAAATEFAGQLAGALKVAASDVKVQVEWNPRRVTSWRQIGYAKHQLKKEQFRDNTVDAAEIGAAEAGNALYTVQVNPAGEGPLGVVRVRFKVPGTSDYREHEWPLRYEGPSRPLEQSSAAIRLAASASAFSEWLVSSPFAAEVTPDRLLGYLRGVPATWGVDGRPKKLEWMIRQAKSVSGK